MPLLSIIYRSPEITITRDFISLPGRDPETISIGRISEVRVTRILIGDYKAGAILFFVIGILTVVWVIGWFFLVMAVAAWNTSIYAYSLVAVVDGKGMILLSNKSKSRMKSLANTISGLSLSRNVLALQHIGKDYQNKQE